MRCEQDVSDAEQFIEDLDFPLRRYAEWRRLKADRHPFDTRNLKSAEMADNIANGMKNLSRDILTKLQPHAIRDEYDCCELLEETEEMIQRLGFDYSASSASEFISMIIPR